ncbi:MAG: TraR/DksA C4-type zinc finger protein [Candidatus Marinimicrobia bacterium]|nr:TraR/DksA C4-type zinc finger protein [Candidatus Neomarinimicrobiota bacterium]MCF7850779.1 TraR/DksA C4-type zinc finger protein [Candidatus Neomarinimicrobiota bacterium]
MKASDKSQIKARIQDEIADASQLIEELEELTQPIAPDAAIGRLSRMEALNNKSVNEHLLQKTQAKLQKLESSLKRVEREDYGKCRSCNEPIPVGRLMMLPESEKCVNCA